MGVIIGEELPSKLVEYLRGHRVVYVATVDQDGWPDTAPISWIVAVSPRIIRMAIDSGVETVANIRSNGHVRISVLGGNLTVSIKGEARIIKERMDSVIVPTTMIEVEVLEVKDDGFWGRNDVEGEALPWSQRRQVASDVAILAELRSEIPSSVL
ncbi:MAG TPA: pyridoxamine 5'-phosphate oxidase family protein [Chloroflexota bacterium]|jgi:DMSO/TMAO reductase YedYZ molybdopterin-dependent catalytic subunit|nr:pyridoxamine 5'-phosphate oxidase family protein [Chloroflexota bacterium]